MMLIAVLALLVGTLIPLTITPNVRVGETPQTTTQLGVKPLATPTQSLGGVNELVGNGLTTFKSYEDIAEFLRNITSLTTFTVMSGIYGGVVPLATVVTVTPTVTISSEVTTLKGGVTRVSGTNVQVVGVDEPDLVKCDGRLLVVASGSKVSIVGVVEKELITTLKFSDEYVKGLYLHNNTLVVITESRPTIRPLLINDLELGCRCGFTVPSGTVNTSVYVYNVLSPKTPELKFKVWVVGPTLTSRLNGRYLYLITTLPITTPTIPIVNDVVLSPGSIVRVDKYPNTYTTITSIDVLNGNYSTYSFMTGYSSWLYMSPKNLYLVSSTTPTYVDAYITVIKLLSKYLPHDIASKVVSMLDSGDFSGCLELLVNYLSSLSLDEVKSLFSRVSDEVGKVVFNEVSRFYTFSVNGTSVMFRGYFEVSGRVLDQFSMEELGNYFIVATTSTNYTVRVVYQPTPIVITPTPTTVKVSECFRDSCVEKVLTITSKPQELPKPTFYVSLQPVTTENNVFTVDVSSLKVVGSLKGLAEGERVYSARLLMNTFYLVTYRRVDPLYAIDVSDPTKPKVLGYLKIPGFSEYLHPLPNNRLLGIGVEDGLKISLINISDPKNMSEISKVRVEGGWSQALQDHHAVTVDLDNELVMIPVVVRGSSGVTVVSYSGDSLILKKFIEHEGVFRTVYVGDELYSISPKLVKVYNIKDFKELYEVVLGG